MTTPVLADFLYDDPDPYVIWLKKAMLVMAVAGPVVVLTIYFLAGR